ncbi:MAG TPA: hypothetical protein VKA69_09060 [Desulfobacteria bacterium]|nr:hypothetical protein [Desulfobacteria bacterium]
MIFSETGRGGKFAVNPVRTNFLLVLVVLLICLYVCGPGVSEPDGWDDLLKHQHQEFVETSKSVDPLISKLPHRLSDLQKHLYLLTIEKAGPQTQVKITAYLKDLVALETKLEPLSRKLIQGMDAAQFFVAEPEKDRAQIEYESNPVSKTHLVKRAPVFFGLKNSHSNDS